MGKIPSITYVTYVEYVASYLSITQKNKYALSERKGTIYIMTFTVTPEYKRMPSITKVLIFLTKHKRLNS